MNFEEFKLRMVDEVEQLAKIKEHTELNEEQQQKRRSRASLNWFLINYFKIDEDITADYICDETDDKGIDGIYADEYSREIFIFQSKYSKTPGSNEGDTNLKQFNGVEEWFKSPENVQSLDNSIANLELKGLINRLSLVDKIEQEYVINLIFITNRIFDTNGKQYLNVVGDNFEGWDLNRLFAAYTYAEKDKPVPYQYTFNIDINNIIRYPILSDAELIAFPARATDIISLEGIQDGSLFDKNVRYWLGKTRINREIANTLKTEAEHSNILVYNNGITIICESMTIDSGAIHIENYAVVNGCQTVLTLFENKQVLSEDIYIIVRVIKTGKDEELARKITRYNNNQNAINPRDLKSNDRVQEVIQKQIFDYFDNKILYNIKRGESEAGYETVMRNDFVAQLIVSFMLLEPYTAHQKTQIFETNYSKIFSRHINPPLIYLLWEMYRIIDINCSSIVNPGAADYRTTRFFLMSIFRQIFDKDPLGIKLATNADSFYKTYKGRYRQVFDKLSKMLIMDFNHYIQTKQKGVEYFDYKNILRNAPMSQEMAVAIIADYETSLIFHEEGKVSNLLST